MFVIKPENEELSLKVVQHKLNEYISTCETPCFFELINLLGLTWSEWLSFVLDDADHPSVKLLMRYKEFLESQMEKMLIYQTKNYYNYKELEWVLTRSNPLKYGAKVEIKNTNKVNNFEFGKELENESEISLLKLSN